MATVVVYSQMGNIKSTTIGEYLIAGIKAAGDKPIHRYSQQYRGIEGDIAIMYGLSKEMKRIYDDYRRKSQIVTLDLGYWRFQKFKLKNPDGFLKFGVNGRHAENYCMKFSSDSSRRAALNVTLKPWKNNTGGKILLAGMAKRAAVVAGFQNQQWEQNAVLELRKYTNRSIIFRPKPKRPGAFPIRDTQYDRGMPLSQAFDAAYCIVTHHSNVGIDAIIEGIPVFTKEGIASIVGCSDLSKINTPYQPDNREEWLNAVSWSQFRPSEIKTGMPWVLFKENGIIL